MAGRYSASEIKEAGEKLTELLKDATEVQVILRHVSASGMTRWLDLAVVHDGELQRFGWSAACILDWGYSHKHNGVKVDGCGMDMGFHLVSSVCTRLGWPYDKIRHHWL